MTIPQPVTEMFIDGAWVDVTVTDDVLARDPISIIRGRANEAPGSRPRKIGRAHV